MAAVAGAFAAVLGFAELVFSLPKNRPLSPRAWRWVSARLAADFAVAAIAFPLVAATGLNKQPHPEPLITALIAAGSGAVLLRTQISVARRSGARAPVGLVVLYERLRIHSTKRIESINATAQTDWLIDEVLPCLAMLEAHELRQRALVYVNTLATSKRRTQSEAYIEATVASGLTEDQQRLSLAQHLIDIDGRDMVKSLMRAGKRHANGCT